MGNAVFIILIALAVLGAVVSLVRGIITFLRTTEEDLRNTGNGPSQSSLKQNKMMMARVTFQALAILLVALLLLLNSGHH